MRFGAAEWKKRVRHEFGRGWKELADEWAADGLPRYLIAQRLGISSMTLFRALGRSPLRERVEGKSKRQWAQEFGVPYETFIYRCNVHGFANCVQMHERGEFERRAA